MNALTLCPEYLIEKANHFAACIGLTDQDLNTFVLNWEKGADQFAASNPTVPATMGAFLQSDAPLSRPAWDTENTVNISWAEEIRAGIEWYIPQYDEDGELTNPPTVPTSGLLVAINQKPSWLFGLMGLTRIEHDE